MQFCHLKSKINASKSKGRTQKGRKTKTHFLAKMRGEMNATGTELLELEMAHAEVDRIERAFCGVEGVLEAGVEGGGGGVGARWWGGRGGPPPPPRRPASPCRSGCCGTAPQSRSPRTTAATPRPRPAAPAAPTPPRTRPRACPRRSVPPASSTPP